MDPEKQSQESAEQEEQQQQQVPPKVEDKKPLLVPAPEEKQYVDPNSPEYLAQLEQEGAERRELETQIAPYELVPQQFKADADAYRTDMVNIARDAGIPPAEAEVLLHLAIGDTMEAVSKDQNAVLGPGQLPGPDLANPRACMTILRHRFGETAAAVIVKTAQEEFRSLPQSVRDYLDHDNGDGRLLTNSPSVLLMLAVKRLGWTRISQEGAQKELNALNDKSKALEPAEQKRMNELVIKKQELARLHGELQPSEQRELDALKRRGQKLDAFDLVKRQVLSHITGRGKSSEHKGLAEAAKSKSTPKAAPSATAKLEAELKTIRLDKGYWDKSAPNHKALQARVAAIYSELYLEKK